MCGFMKPDIPKPEARDVLAEESAADRQATRAANAKQAARKRRRAAQSVLTNVGGAQGVESLAAANKTTLG